MVVLTGQAVLVSKRQMHTEREEATDDTAALAQEMEELVKQPEAVTELAKAIEEDPKVAEQVAKIGAPKTPGLMWSLLNKFASFAKRAEKGQEAAEAKAEELKEDAEQKAAEMKEEKVDGEAQAGSQAAEVSPAGEVAPVAAAAEAPAAKAPAVEAPAAKAPAAATNAKQSDAAKGSCDDEADSCDGGKKQGEDEKNTN